MKTGIINPICIQIIKAACKYEWFNTPSLTYFLVSVANPLSLDIRPFLFFSFFEAIILAFLASTVFGLFSSSLNSEFSLLLLLSSAALASLSLNLFKFLLNV